MNKIFDNKFKNFNLLSFGFTLVELLGVIIILGVIALITFPIIDKSIKSSKEKALEQVIDSIEKAAYEYSISNDIGYQIFYNKIELSTLISAGILKDNIINPVTDEQMQGCVLYKWVEEYKQYEFKYDELCEIEETNPYVTMSYDKTLINSKGWINSNFAVTLGGNGEIKYCISSEECEPSEVIDVGNYTKFIVNNGTNYICGNTSNSLGVSETKCEKFNLDKNAPLISTKTDNINVDQKESNNVLNFLNITYGLSGGNISCDVNNTEDLLVGTHSINCVAVGNNGLSTTKTFAVTINKVYFDYEIKIIWDSDTFELPEGIEIYLYNETGPIYSFITGAKTTEYNGEYIVYAKNVPKYDENNNEISYYLTGEKYISGQSEYTPVAISNNEIKINYKYNQPTSTTIEIMATFENLDMLPESIDFNLLRNGVIYKNATLNANNNWKYTVVETSNMGNYSINILNIDGLGNYDYFITIKDNTILITVISSDEDIDDDAPPL